MFYTIETKDNEYFNNEKRDYTFTETVTLFRNKINFPGSWIVKTKGKEINGTHFSALINNDVKEEIIFHQYMKQV